jgi:radical SAM protein with 4Fe4S-binding SPASM domain
VVTKGGTMESGEALTPFPIRISIETVGSCNAACTFCPHPALGKNERRERMSPRVFATILDQCAGQHDLCSVTLSFQNEPLTDPHLAPRIAATRARLPGVDIAMVTNAALLRGRPLARLMQHPPDLIKMSVSSIDEDEYESTMQGLRYADVMQNILAVRDWSEANGGHPRLLINCVYPLAGSRRSLREIKEFWQERRLELHVINLENRAGFFTSRDMQTLTALPLHPRSWCKRPEEQLSIWPNGDVALCCADWTKQVVLGNVLAQPLGEIWHGPTIRKYRVALRTGAGHTVSPCATCDQAQIEFEGRVFINAENLAERIT